eukprot:11403231-Alexandrium_andersonii.AAC.1
MSASLVGSEMCIRDRDCSAWRTADCRAADCRAVDCNSADRRAADCRDADCLLYTSDAADDM